MPHPLRLCLVLHNHQPIGDFDGVFDQAYQDSYLPFLDVFESYPDPLRFSLHTSGPLMEWFDERHPEYLDRLARLVSAGRIEIVGGVLSAAASVTNVASDVCVVLLSTSVALTWKWYVVLAVRPVNCTEWLVPFDADATVPPE